MALFCPGIGTPPVTAANATEPNDNYSVEVVVDQKNGTVTYILYKNGEEVKRIVTELKKKEPTD